MSTHLKFLREERIKKTVSQSSLLTRRAELEKERSLKQMLTRRHYGSQMPLSSLEHKELSSDISPGLNDRQLLKSVMNYYQETLQDSPEALDYLEEMGLSDLELLHAFKIGYANRTLTYHISDRTADERLATRSQLKEIGILRANGQELFQNCLVVPLMDEEGDVTGAYGHSLMRHKREPSLNGPLFNAQGLAGAKSIIVADTLLDALTFWVAGLRQVTFFPDESLFKSFLASAKKEGIEAIYSTSSSTSSSDQNPPEELQKLFNQSGIAIYRIELPKMSANQYWRQHQDSAYMEKLILTAERLPL
ncbi:MAG: primase [Chlamydiales bacterium]|nr:primase [Chlamydiales bacterium]